MYWEVLVPASNEMLASSTTVEADTWFAALRDGLARQGLGTQLMSNLSCDIKPDKTVHVTDFISQKTFILRPIEKSEEAEKKKKHSGNPSPSPSSPLKSKPPETSRKTKPPGPLRKILSPFTKALPKVEKPKEFLSDLAANLPQAEIFFQKDEASLGDKPIYYRERLLAVDSATGKQEAGRLVLSIFYSLKNKVHEPGTQLYITVQVFDHSFKESAKRPAIAAISWKEWNPNETQLQFPLSGDEGIRLSRVPPPEGRSSKDKKNDPTASNNILAPKKTATRKRIRVTNLPVEDIIIQVFERMQDIYNVREHDNAAAFVLELAAEYINCEAGSIMLFTPGCYDLYVAAAHGPMAKKVLGKRLSLSKGIVGFATRTGAVITISDPENDDRFHQNFDTASSFETKSVVCAPIQYEGKTIGALELLNSTREEGFTQEEANVLSYIAGAVGEYIDTSLPSREADFSNREFSNLSPKLKAKGISGTKKTKVQDKSAQPKRRLPKQPLANPGMKQKKRKSKKK